MNEITSAPMRAFLSTLIAIGVPGIACGCMYLEGLFVDAYHFGNGDITALALFRFAIGVVLALCAYLVVAASIRAIPNSVILYAVGLAVFATVLAIRPDITLGSYLPMVFAALYAICLLRAVVRSVKTA